MRELDRPVGIDGSVFIGTGFHDQPFRRMSTGNIEIEHIHPPVSPDEVISLLWHKGPPWVEDIRQRLLGAREGSRDHFWLARHDGKVVANVWYTVASSNPQLGLIGHIYTAPDFRRKGISSQLITAAMRHFAGHGGKVMQLFTSTPYTVPLYETFGFENLYHNRSYHETDWYMRSPAGSRQRIDQWYHQPPFRQRALHAGDLPAYSLLYNWEFQTRLKDWAQELGLGLEAEYAFINTLGRMSRKQAQCSVLANDHVIAAVCSLVPLAFPHQAHVAVADAYVHAEHTERFADLMQHCLDRRAAMGVEKVFALVADAEKRRRMQDLSFRVIARLPAAYRIGGEAFDCELLSLD
jgi:N-acetylglutamate synthase-like GNAT family acetyltransferase